MLNIKIQRNNTFLAMPFEVIKDDVPVDLSNAVITLVAKSSDCAEPILTLQTGEAGGISFVDAENGLFQIDEQIFTIKKGVYDYGITFELDFGTFTWGVGKLIVE